MSWDFPCLLMRLSLLCQEICLVLSSCLVFVFPLDFYGLVMRFCLSWALPCLVMGLSTCFRKSFLYCHTLFSFSGHEFILVMSWCFPLLLSSHELLKACHAMMFLCQVLSFFLILSWCFLVLSWVFFSCFALRIFLSCHGFCLVMAIFFLVFSRVYPCLVMSCPWFLMSFSLSCHEVFLNV